MSKLRIEIESPTVIFVMQDDEFGRWRCVRRRRDGRDTVRLGTINSEGLFVLMVPSHPGLYPRLTPKEMRDIATFMDRTRLKEEDQEPAA